LRDKRNSSSFHQFELSPHKGSDNQSNKSSSKLRPLPVLPKNNNITAPPVGISMIEFLKRFVTLELNLERQKNELALLFDFTFEEAFKVLDTAKNKEILAEDLMQSLLTRFGISSFNIKEISLFM
jgi:hypothetical protein